MIERIGTKDGFPRRPRSVRDVIARLRVWLGDSIQSRAGMAPLAAIESMSSVERIGPFSGRHLPDTSRNPGFRDRNSMTGRTVIALPITRRQQLNQLARDIRTRFGDAGDASSEDQLLLTVVAVPKPRLYIDRTAHIEVREETNPYRVVLGDEFDTRVILETADFGLVQEFICQYLVLTRDEVFSAEGSP